MLLLLSCYQTTTIAATKTRVSSSSLLRGTTHHATSISNNDEGTIKQSTVVVDSGTSGRRRRRLPKKNSRSNDDTDESPTASPTTTTITTDNNQQGDEQPPSLPPEEQPKCYTGSVHYVTEACKSTGTEKCCTGGINPCHDWLGNNTVCEGSCIGNYACNRMTLNTTISPNSCIGDSACSSFGGRNYPSGDEPNTNNGKAIHNNYIGTNSCVGESSCELIAHHNAHSITIHSNSCVGIQACTGLGSEPRGASTEDGDIYTTREVLIRHNSCTSNFACFYTAGAVPLYRIVMEPYACITQNSCSSKCVTSVKNDGNVNGTMYFPTNAICDGGLPTVAR